jgi:hypothetical protein
VVVLGVVVVLQCQDLLVNQEQTLYMVLLIMDILAVVLPVLVQHIMVPEAVALAVLVLMLTQLVLVVLVALVEHQRLPMDLQIQ